MRITNTGTTKEQLREAHNPQVIGARIHCYDCNTDAIAEAADFDGWWPRLSTEVYWYTNEWITKVEGRCPVCGEDNFLALLRSDGRDQ